MKRFTSKCLFPLVLLVSCHLAHSAEWQWSVPVPNPPDRPNDKNRAFLWIPANCKQVRGVVFGQHNMEEQPILEHPVFRKTLEELGFAEVWVVPTFDRNFRFDQGAGERFESMLQALAERSGYQEIASAPLVPVGHSAAASLPWYIAAWKPDRVLACISFSGQWPYVPDPNEAPQVLGRTLDTVPGLVTAGEYEWADESMAKGLKCRAEHPKLPLSGVGCPADGHFAVMDEKVAFLALYLKKAALYRLPKEQMQLPDNQPVKLNEIDPAMTGWLVDRYHKGKGPSAPAAPVGKYTGDPAQAFWFFDEELAKAAEAYQGRQIGKATLLGYVQDGKLLPQTKGSHAQVEINFAPLADGVTFKLSGTFLDTVPEGRPVRWADKKAGDPVEKPSFGSAPIEIRRITGPIRKISDDTWMLAFDRSSFLGDRRGNEAWLAAVWPGDGKFKRAIQQAVLHIPGRVTSGAPQSITFAPPENIRVGTPRVKLSAKSSSGLPVRFFVREGPAEVEGENMLKLTAIPPRAKFPVKVSVVAWQFGDKKFQSAEPVETSFLVTK